jgi:hypothetical protein
MLPGRIGLSGRPGFDAVIQLRAGLKLTSLKDMGAERCGARKTVVTKRL